MPIDRTDLARATAELRTALAAADSGSARLDLIFSTEDPRALVRHLPVQDLYLLIKDIGVAGAGDLVALASPEQFRTFVDLDAWKKDRFDVTRAMAWILASRGGKAKPAEKKLRTLDIEVLEMVLRTTTRIYALSENSDVETTGAPYRTTDGQFVIEFLVEGDEMVVIREIIESLYEDPIPAARFLEACRWELPSELEETAFRFRAARLADLGFPDIAESLSYLAYRDPDAPLNTAAPRIPKASGFYLAPLTRGAPFFDAVLAHLPSDVSDRLFAALPLVANAVMVFESVEVGDPEAVRRSATGVRDTLSLGLEHLSQGDPEQAAILLGHAPLKEVFRVGVSLALKLKFRSDRIMRTGLASFPSSPAVPLFDPPVGEAIVALRRRRPLYSRLVEGPSNPDKPQHFRSRADLRSVERALQSAEKILVLFKAWAWDPVAAGGSFRAAEDPARLAPIRFSDLFLTAAARESVGEGFAFAPLPVSRVQDAMTKAFDHSGSEVRVRQEFESALELRIRTADADEATRSVGADFLAYCLTRLTTEIGARFARSGAIDPGVRSPWIVAV